MKLEKQVVHTLPCVKFKIKIIYLLRMLSESEKKSAQIIDSNQSMRNLCRNSSEHIFSNVFASSFLKQSLKILLMHQIIMK